MNRPIAVAAALVIAAGAPPTHAAAQHSATPDSQAVLRAAQTAQVRFERTRRRYMRWGNPTYGSCEIRIGRYCPSNLDWGDEETWTEPVEAPAVGVARLSLIARLDSAVGQNPNGQHVLCLALSSATTKPRTGKRPYRSNPKTAGTIPIF